MDAARKPRQRSAGALADTRHMSEILTIDLGTTYFKAALFDDAGELVALHRVPAPTRSPQRQWLEMDVADFRRTITQAVAAVAASRPGGLADVAAVTFATQTNSFALLDGDDQPLTPLILWPDARAAAYEDRLKRLMQLPDFTARTGVPDLAREFMAAKLLMLAAEQPTVWARARRLCLISDYLGLWLTGRCASEGGAAGLTGLVDIHKLDWWPDALAGIGLPRDWLGEVVRAGTDLGPLRAGAAAELGLPASCRFVVGCLDQYAGAIGGGCIGPGTMSETTGTVLAAVRCSDRFEPSPPAGVYQGPAFDEGLCFQMAFGSTSANLLEWYRNQLPDRPDFAALGQQAAAVPPLCQGLRANPRADLCATEAEAFENRLPHHGRGHCVRAIMEQVAFALARQVGQLTGGVAPREIRSSGGAARSELWLSIKADVLGVPFAATVCPEPTSQGSAMLAACTLGWGSLPDLVSRWAQAAPAKLPDPARRLAYAQAMP